MHPSIKEARRWRKGLGLGVIACGFALVCAFGLIAIQIGVIQPAAGRRGFMDLAERANMAWAPFVFVTIPLCVMVRGMTRKPVGLKLSAKFESIRRITRLYLPVALLLAAALRALILIGSGDYGRHRRPLCSSFLLP